MIVPLFVMVCADEPLRLTVRGLVGLKTSVAPVLTVMSPLIAWPGAPVMPRLKVPRVTVKLSITTALPPVTPRGTSHVLFEVGVSATGERRRNGSVQSNRDFRAGM